MCGICGKIAFDGSPVDAELIARMCRSFSHRGPDDQGIYTGLERSGAVRAGLGHRRLSIIDLSPAGRQPMSNEDETLWIVCNGEIYNFRELRAALCRKGHIFRSDSDTEVILHLYEEEGVRAVERLRGMFAFALWDAVAGRLWLCRDRLGIKPLVYCHGKTSLVFASEIKAVLCDPAVSKEMDAEALRLYLAFGYTPAPWTMFKGVRKVPPGCSLIVEGGGLRTETYWEVPRRSVGPTFSGGDKEPAKKLAFLLDEAVREHLISDVPLGAFLSGGIDSSILVALMARHAAGPVKTFTVGFRNAPLYDETRFAREVAERFRTDHREILLDHKDLLDVLPDVLDQLDEPFGDSSALPTYVVSRQTRQHVTVALSGDGGDELFGGYRSYLGEYWQKWYHKIPPAPKRWLEGAVLGLPDSRESRIPEHIRRAKKFIRASRGDFPSRMLRLREIFPGEIRGSILRGSNAPEKDPALERMEASLGAFQGDRINRMLYADVRDLLPGDMLTKVDWMSMRNSLEVRVPFLDHRVVEFAFSLDGSWKLRRAKTKYLLREAFKDVLPRHIRNRPKAGFEVPVSRWLRHELRFLLERYLGTERIREEGVFHPGVVSRLIRDHLTGRTDTSWMLWHLIVFQRWREKYLR